MRGTLSTSPGPVLTDIPEWVLSVKKENTLWIYLCFGLGFGPYSPGRCVFFPCKTKWLLCTYLGSISPPYVGILPVYLSRGKGKYSTSIDGQPLQKEEPRHSVHAAFLYSCEGLTLNYPTMALQGPEKHKYSGEEGTEKHLTTLFWYWCSPASLNSTFKGHAMRTSVFLKKRNWILILAEEPC